MKSKKELIEIARKRMEEGGDRFCAECFWPKRQGKDKCDCGFWSEELNAGWYRKDFNMWGEVVFMSNTLEGAIQLAKEGK